MSKRMKDKIAIIGGSRSMGKDLAMKKLMDDIFHKDPMARILVVSSKGNEVIEGTEFEEVTPGQLPSGIPKEIEDAIAENGYYNIRVIEGKGVCGINRFMFTYGLVVNLDATGYSDRYCYHTEGEATEALSAWDGTGHPPGNWIKHKGYKVDETNPNYIKP